VDVVCPVRTRALLVTHAYCVWALSRC
jgi:hypothetical protein